MHSLFSHSLSSCSARSTASFMGLLDLSRHLGNRSIAVMRTKSISFISSVFNRFYTKQTRHTTIHSFFYHAMFFGLSLNTSGSELEI